MYDGLKISFRNVIKDAPGEIIENDDLISVDVKKPESVKFMEKEARYVVHRQSVLSAADLQHQVEIVDERKGFFGSFFSELRPTSISTGYIRKKKNLDVIARGQSASFEYPSRL